MRSIRRWLLGWLIFGLAATSLAAAYGIFDTARREAGELFDYELRTVALSLPANIATADAAEQRSHDFDGIADDRIEIDIWNKQGQLVYHSLKEPALPRVAEGFRSIERGEYRWRVFGLQQPDFRRAGVFPKLAVQILSAARKPCAVLEAGWIADRIK